MLKGLAKYENDFLFQSYFSKYDVIGLCETWAIKGDNFESFLPGYISFDFIRPKKRTAYRGSGGVSVFVKESLVKDGILKRIFNNFSECVILILDGNFFQAINDVILLFAYVSPENSPFYAENDNNGIENLNINLEKVVTKYPEAHLLLAGDLNSRITDFFDYVPDDDVSCIFGDNIAYPNDEFSLSRKTKDMQYNRFGLSLIELCCTYGIHTLNGRLFNDTEGNYTCIANEGASIVDYMIASTHLFQFFTDFGIDDMDWSVHFPLFCKLNFTLNEQYNHSLKSNVHLETWQKFKWKPELKEVYMDTFRENFSKLEAELSIRPQNSLFTFLPKFIDIVKFSAGQMVSRKSFCNSTIMV